MITKEIVKAEIENVPEESLEKLYRIIKDFEKPKGTMNSEIFLHEIRTLREKVGGYLTDEELKRIKEEGRE